MLILVFVEEKWFLHKELLSVWRVVVGLLDLVFAVAKAANFASLNLLCFKCLCPCDAAACPVCHESIWIIQSHLPTFDPYWALS